LRLAFLASAVLGLATPAIAQDCAADGCASYPRTTLLEIRREQPPVRDLELVKFGGYELADGRFQSFNNWYAGRLVTTRAEFVTQFSPGIALLWGLSTGENREKYQLQPAVRIGILAVRSLGGSTTLSFSARTTFAGRLRERPCTANYGDIGGVQSVNCRLAASEMAPADTLQYLWNFRQPDHTQATIRLTTLF
jgi:hypothetical protein